MSEPQNSGLNEPAGEERRGSVAESHPRAVGSPLPVGSASAASQAGAHNAALGQFGPQAPGAVPPGRALTSSSSNSALDGPSGVQKAMGALKAAMPFVQRLLPLLDGNIAAAVSNMLAPHHAPPPPPPPVNLAPIEDGLAELATQQRELVSQQRELRSQVVEQNSSLKRVEDQLEMVREATDRNTLEQQELLEDLKVVGNKVNLFAMIALGLLGLSVLLNIVLYLHILRVLP